MAANIDQVFVVFAHEPAPQALLLDSYLVAMAYLGFATVLLLNKVDLVTTETAPLSEGLFRFYEQLGYPIIRVSSLTGEGLAELEARLKDHRSIFVGQSGVGKSSLINHILPKLDLAVGIVSEKTHQGSHTTT